MTTTTTTLSAARMLRELARRMESAERAAIKTTAARSALPAGSSRARVTTANARWTRAAEHRDRVDRGAPGAGGCVVSRWTPHPSHLAWETIEGERYCRVCGTGDTDAWPLCESPCSATTPTRALESREHMTGAELREAIRYREGGASWLAVGQMLGRNHHAVQRAVEAYQAGRGRVARRERGAA